MAKKASEQKFKIAEAAAKSTFKAAKATFENAKLAYENVSREARVTHAIERIASYNQCKDDLKAGGYPTTPKKT